MEELVSYLRQFDASDLPDGDDDVILHHSDHELVAMIECIATEIFIGEEGDPLFSEIDRLLREYDYFIFPGDRDRYGWLTACLRTKKGVIVFG